MGTVWENSVMAGIRTLFDKLILSAPNVLLAIFVLMVGIVLAKAIRKLILTIMCRYKFEALCSQIGITDFLKKLHPKPKPNLIMANLFYWVTISITVMIDLEILGLNEVTRLIISFLLYFPNILFAFLILIAGIYVAKLSKKLLKEKIQTRKYLFLDEFGIPLVQGAIIFTAFSMALYQIGVARGLIASIYIVVIASMGLVIFLSFGLASIEIARGALTGRILLRPTLKEKPSNLTPKQHELFVFLKDFTMRNNCSPIIREIQEALGDKSTKSVVFKLRVLEEKGYIRKEKRKHRSIVILK